MSDLEDAGATWDDGPHTMGNEHTQGWTVTAVFIIAGLLGIWLLSA